MVWPCAKLASARLFAARLMSTYLEAACPSPLVRLLLPTHRRDFHFGPVLLEPAPEVELRAEEVGGRRARAVPLVVEARHRRRDAAELERLVELLGLRDRRAQVVDAGHEHRRRLHVADVHERGAAEVLARVLPRQLGE